MKLAIAATILLGSLGCDSNEDGIELPDWSDGFPANNNADAGPQSDAGETLGGTVVISVAEENAYDTRFGLALNLDLDCAIDTSAAAFREIDCRVEVKELDLYARGFAYSIAVPAETCEYLKISSYMYQAWELGTGPALVHYRVDEDGNFLSDVEGSLNGEPFCEFDHSTLEPDNPEAPNCCFGSFNTLVTVVDAGGGETDQPLVGPVEWGAEKVGDCYAGAAYTSNITQIDDISGLPLNTIVGLDETVDNAFGVVFDAPIDKPESSNVTIANFLDDSDSTPIGHTGTFSQPDYIIECLDEAQEVSARFRITVREWDEVSEFETDGDPDTGRKSSPGDSRPLENNGSGSPINDYFDWSDFVLEGNGFVHSSD